MNASTSLPNSKQSPKLINNSASRIALNKILRQLINFLILNQYIFQDKPLIILKQPLAPANNNSASRIALNKILRQLIILK